VSETGDVIIQSGDDQARSHADYAKVHRQIVTVLSDFDNDPARYNPEGVAQAESALASLMPQPSIVLPLPPASEDMVAFVAQVCQSVALQSAQTRASLSNVSAATVAAATA
jgi:L-lactate utilization protein LutC